MDLPTYTNIWRIEKRLYKLYDLRLPMPLPLVQIGVFVGVFVPWIVLLRVVGIPFHAPWHVLYIVPPGVLTWMATRPVIEGKRLTELLLSQTRYLLEPRTWCRLTPIREPREVVVTVKVWRRAGTAVAVSAPEPVLVAAQTRARLGRAEHEAQTRQSRGAERVATAAPGRSSGAAAGVGLSLRSAQRARPLSLSEQIEALEATTAGTLPPPSVQAALAARHAASAEPVPDAGRPLPVPDAVGSVPVPDAIGPQDPGWFAEMDRVQAPPGAAQAARGAEATVVPPAMHEGDEEDEGTGGVEAPGRGAGWRSIAKWPPPAPKGRPAVSKGPAEVGGAVLPVEPPPATPRLETGPAATPVREGAPVSQAAQSDASADQETGPAVPPAEQGSGKRAVASGVRRPGSTAEFWTALGRPADGEPTPAAAESGELAEPGGAAEQAEPGGLAEPDAPVQPVGRRASAESAPSASSKARTTQPDIPVVAPADTRPDIPMVPGAFGATGRNTPSSPEPMAPERVAAEPMAPERVAAEPMAPEPVAAEPMAPEPVAAEPVVPVEATPAAGADVPGEPTPAAESGGREPAVGQAAQLPPPVNLAQLGEPLREVRDALVWPPEGRRRTRRPKADWSAGQEPTPATAEETTPVPIPTATPAQPTPPPAQPTPPPAQPTPAAPERPAANLKPWPPKRPTGTPATEAGEPSKQPPQAPRQRSAGQPASPPAPQRTPHKARPPMPVPDPGPAAEAPGQPHRPADEAPGQSQRPAATGRIGPPRETLTGPAAPVRSGPASPVRPRPRPLTPPEPPPTPQGAITPPDVDQEGTAGGLRRLIQAVGGGSGQFDAEYEERLQRPFQGTRRIVVLGCTGGAGQSVTGLMVGHTFAQYCGEPIVAIDVNPGPGSLAHRTRSETPETLTGLIARADQVHNLTAMRRYTSQAKSGLEVIAGGKNPLQALDDRDYALAIRTLDRFYSITILDAAAAIVARVLPHADQIVLVAPASADAPRAVAMTFEWLDGHGYAELRSRAVTVINGVSRRSLEDVEQAETVARGRCRALVRIPWDDHLSLDRAPRNELKSLRAPTRRAFLALAGVVAGGFGALPERYQQEPQDEQGQIGWEQEANR